MVHFKRSDADNCLSGDVLMHTCFKNMAMQYNDLKERCRKEYLASTLSSSIDFFVTSSMLLHMCCLLL